MGCHSALLNQSSGGVLGCRRAMVHRGCSAGWKTRSTKIGMDRSWWMGCRFRLIKPKMCAGRRRGLGVRQTGSSSPRIESKTLDGLVLRFIKPKFRRSARESGGAGGSRLFCRLENPQYEDWDGSEVVDGLPVPLY
jgi:hypothetical protein